jgi:hypothetical protein
VNLMTTESGRYSKRSGRLLARLAVGLGSLAPAASATELVTARPHEFVVGSPRGHAIAPDIDTSGSRHAPELPPPEAAQVIWQRHVPGGVSANLLVDADDRIFAVGPSRVTQLGADGTLEFSQAADFSSAAAAALLTDGSRAVLTREGQVLGWSPTGTVTFVVVLEAPLPQGSISLLPLPDGGVLASVGQWLFEIDVTRAVRSYARLPASIRHTLLVGCRAIAVDAQGSVFEWDRRELPRRLGAFSAPLASVLADAGSLLGVTSRRTVERLDRYDNGLRELLRLDPSGAAPLLASIEAGRWVVMKPDGTWFSVGVDAPAQVSGQRAMPDTANHIALLADSVGSVAWWASDVPLHLETASGVGRELPDVRCALPVGLVPAGRARVVAACSSGVVWLVGPSLGPDR